MLLNCAYAALLLGLLMGCDPRGEDPAVGTKVDPLIGNIGAAEELTFWWYSGDRTQIVTALECAIQRIRAATCLPIDVSVDARHWIRQRPPAEMPGNYGVTWTSDGWQTTRIALRTDLPTDFARCDVLVHEIAQHTMRATSTHAGPIYGLSEPLLNEVCSVQDCECFNPEIP